MSYLTDAEKAALTADFRAATDTWMRPLLIFQEAQRTIISQNINYTPLNAYNQNSTAVQNTPVSSIISGRILWDKNQEWDYIKPFGGRGANEGQLKAKDQTSRACRIKVDISGYNLLAPVKLVEVDGFQLVPQSQPRPHGLFAPNSYTFYYVRQM